MLKELLKVLAASKDFQRTLQHQHNLTLKCNIKVNNKVNGQDRNVDGFLAFGADVESLDELIGLVQVILGRFDATVTVKEEGGK